MDIDTYWETTPAKFNKYLEVYKEKQEERAREMDVNNFNLGHYLMVAFNDPSKYPKKPFLHEESSSNKVMTPEEMDWMMRKNTIKLGGKVNDRKR